MKFNKYLPLETREFLEKQYKEYIRETAMTKKEQRVLRDWVKDGHSVYENASLTFSEGGVPVEFLTVWRDEEYIRQHTKGLSPEETRKFAMDYYGWDDDESEADQESLAEALKRMEEIELPFQ